jgi:hypothetical protein
MGAFTTESGVVLVWSDGNCRVLAWFGIDDLARS